MDRCARWGRGRYLDAMCLNNVHTGHVPFASKYCFVAVVLLLLGSRQQSRSKSQLNICGRWGRVFYVVWLLQGRPSSVHPLFSLCLPPHVHVHSCTDVVLLVLLDLRQINLACKMRDCNQAMDEEISHAAVEKVLVGWDMVSVYRVRS